MTGGPGGTAAGDRAGGQVPVSAVAWGVVGVIAQAAFTGGWLIAETWQGSRYSPVSDTISDMQAATAPHLEFIVACFAVGGIGTFCFAVFGLRPALAGAGKTAARAPWMLAFAGLVLGNSFPLIPCQLTDPGCSAHHQLYSPGGLTDAIAASLAFVVLVFTPGQLWRRMKVLPRWRRLKPVMLTARVVCPLCWILLSVTSIAQTAEGLTERILASSCVLWIGAVALTLTADSGPDRRSRKAGAMPAGDHGAPPPRPLPLAE
jgi:hypothetical protein